MPATIASAVIERPSKRSTSPEDAGPVSTGRRIEGSGLKEPMGRARAAGSSMKTRRLRAASPGSSRPSSPRPMEASPAGPAARDRSIPLSC